MANQPANFVVPHRRSRCGAKENERGRACAFRHRPPAGAPAAQRPVSDLSARPLKPCGQRHRRRTAAVDAAAAERQQPRRISLAVLVVDMILPTPDQRYTAIRPAERVESRLAAAAAGQRHFLYLPSECG